MNFIVAPFAWLMRLFYSFAHNYGVAVILFAIVVKLVLLPFQMKSKKSMVRMGRLTGKQQELQKQYANNQQKYNEELQKLYMEEGINPMGGCLWSFLPLFFILPLYQIIYRPITVFMGISTDLMNTLMETAKGLGFDASAYNVAYEQIGLSNFIHEHWAQFSQYESQGLIDVNFNFLGLNLSSIPRQQFAVLKQGATWAAIGLLLIPVLSALLQYISMQVISKSNGQDQQQQASMRFMNILMLAMSLYWTFIMPGAMGLYWILNTVLMMLQEFFLGKFYTNKLNAEEDEKEAKKREARRMKMEAAQKRMEEWEQEKEKYSKPKKKKPQSKAGTDKKQPSTTEAGRVNDRPYARGRSYKADRYDEEEKEQ